MRMRMSTQSIIKKNHLISVFDRVNMSFACGISGKNFSTQGNLQRHLKYVHGGDNRYNHVSPFVNGSTVMKHPFT